MARVRKRRRFLVMAAFVLIAVWFPLVPAGAVTMETTNETVPLEELTEATPTSTPVSAIEAFEHLEDEAIHPDTGEVSPEPKEDEIVYRAELDAPFDFEMIGLTAGSREQLPSSGRVRARTDGEEWSDWFELDFLGEDRPEDITRWESDARPGTKPVYTGTSTRLQIETVGDPSDLSVSFLDLDGSTLSIWDRIGDFVKSLATPPGRPVSGDPAVISRAQWGADENIRRGPPSYGQVRFSVVHHTEGTNSYSAAQSAGIVRGIYSYHVLTRGWSDIGYNFLVDKYGQIFEGRWGGTANSVIGAHAAGFNTYSTGIAVMGSFVSTGTPAAAMNAVADVLLWKLTIHNVNPLGSTWITSQGGTRWPVGTNVLMDNISGHRDATYTSCPGDFLYVRLPELRSTVASGWPLRPPRPDPLAVNPQPPYWDWQIARDVERDPMTNGALTLDGWGGLHKWGGAGVNTTGGPYWYAWDIARGLALGPSGGGGLVIDGWGGLHEFGDSEISRTGAPYWSGWDIARDVALNPNGRGGLTLDGWGGIHPWGGMTIDRRGAPYWFAWDIARALFLDPSGHGGWTLDAWGGLHAWGGAPQIGPTAYWYGRDFARGTVISQPAWGHMTGYTMDAWGGVHPWDE